jgi:hypothetical protein
MREKPRGKVSAPRFVAFLKCRMIGFMKKEFQVTMVHDFIRAASS